MSHERAVRTRRGGPTNKHPPESRKDVRDPPAFLRMPGGGPLKTPHSASVRIVGAMGREVEKPSEQNDSVTARTQ